MFRPIRDQGEDILDLESLPGGLDHYEKEVEDILTNQRLWSPSWISSRSKKVQHFFLTLEKHLLVT